MRAARRGLITNAAIGAVIFALNLLILGPYLLADFPNQTWNNGYMYIGMAKAFHDYAGGWNPSTYGGAPLRYLYPPIFPGLLGLFSSSFPGHAYHLLTGIAYALTPVAIYALVLQLFRSRLLGGFAALAYGVFPSLAYYFLHSWKVLAQPFAGAPWGYVALIGYEEAPHGLSLLFAILAILAACRNRWIWSSIFTAAVLLTSWPGTVGLAMAFVAVAAGKAREFGIVEAARKMFSTGGIAFGLAAFWMTPGFFLSTSVLNRVVLSHNIPLAPWNGAIWWIIAAAAAIAAAALWRLPRTAGIIVCWTAVTGAIVVTYTLYNVAILPLPHRYMLEFNLCLVLAVTALLSLASKWQPWLVAALIIVGAPGAVHFLRHAWSVQPRAERPQASAGYPIARWLSEHPGDSRVMASGEVEPELSVWTGLAQVGGSGQGVSNPLIFAAQRQIAFGCGADSGKIAELWLRALNAGYFVVNGAASNEYFHWVADPARFASLPVAWRNTADDTIYRMPAQPQPVVVDLDGLKRLPPFRSTSDARFLEAYVQWAAGKRPVSIRWTSASRADFDAELKPGEAILVKTNYDRGWRADQASAAPDPIGFLLLRAAPGARQFHLRFGAAWDTRAGIAITAITIVLLFVRAPGILIAVLALAPAAVAYVMLAAATPATVALAGEAFARLQPPTINPRGIVDAATNAQPPFERGRVLTVYGLNFGGPGDVVRVMADDRPAAIEWRAGNQINFRLPADVPSAVALAVDVHGCRGNSFAVRMR